MADPLKAEQARREQVAAAIEGAKSAVPAVAMLTVPGPDDVRRLVPNRGDDGGE